MHIQENQMHMENPPALLTLAMIRRYYVPIGSRTLFRLISSGRFPRADIGIGGKLRLWKRETVEEWIAAYTGLRRKEIEQLRWGDLHLDAVIPIVQLRCEQTKTGEATTLPLHPLLVQGLRGLPPATPEASLFDFLPEGRTMLRDLTKAGINQADANGRRADFHGLRHTFAKRLDATGCSHATRRALMRHNSGDQTDGYTLAGLSEMYEAVKRLPSPAEGLVAGGGGEVSNSGKVDTRWTRGGHRLTLTGSDAAMPSLPLAVQNPLQNQAFCTHRQPLDRTGLLHHENRDSVEITGPRSSVG